jgi:hypothetical protein
MMAENVNLLFYFFIFWFLVRTACELRRKNSEMLFLGFGSFKEAFWYGWRL